MGLVLLGGTLCRSQTVLEQAGVGYNVGSYHSSADRPQYIGIAVQEEDYHVWGASPVIGPEGKVHSFVSRWAIAEGFGAWLSHCEIARCESDGPDGPFVFQEVVMEGVGGNRWDHQSPIIQTSRKLANAILFNISRTVEGIEKRE